jgi:teichuronic acid biosynthesis protein TuaE
MNSLFSRFTSLGLLLCLLGAQILYIDIGSIRISPYRIYLIFAVPSLILIVFDKTFSRNSLAIYDYVKFVLSWLFFSFVSGLWSLDLIGWLNSVFTMTGGVAMTALIFQYVNNKDEITKMFKIVAVVSVVYVFIGFREIYTGEYKYLIDENKSFYSTISASTSQMGIPIPVAVFGNPNNYALFLIFSLCCTLFVILSSKPKLSKRLYLLLAVLSAFLILATQSRAAIIATIVFAIICVAGSSLILSSKKTVFIWAVFFGLLGVSAIYYFDRFYLVGELLAIEVDDSEMGSDNIRINLLKNGLFFLGNTYLIGVGSGQIGIYMETKSPYFTFGVTDMHNWWMEILASSGIIIFVVYLVVYIKTLRNMMNNVRFNTDTDLRWLNLLGFAFLSSFFVAAVGPSSVLMSEWSWPLLALFMKVPFIGKKAVRNL